MVTMVPAWDKNTGRKLPHDVPRSWLDKGVFPNLASRQSDATKAADKPATVEKKGA